MSSSLVLIALFTVWRGNWTVIALALTRDTAGITRRLITQWIQWDLSPGAMEGVIDAMGE